MEYSPSRRRMIRLSSYIIHFGDAVCGIDCSGVLHQGCSTGVFNRLAFVMNGISNRIYGVPFCDGDWTDEDRGRWDIEFHSNYSLFDKASGIIGRAVVRVGTWINHRFDPHTD